MAGSWGLWEWKEAWRRRGNPNSLGSRTEAGDPNDHSSSLKVLAVTTPKPHSAPIPHLEHPVERFCYPQGQRELAGPRSTSLLNRA